ncbi:MAG: hypothetical protein IKQ69_03870 [Oscillospiraceae bacterium]|nr:hypothetical protein [Oscillospiraceae bacterium]
MKICIIGVYFGVLPNTFPLWLKSCIKNGDVDFLIVTDAAVETDAPNIRVLPMTLSEMQKLASEKIGMEVVLSTPYKCCDYKPVYGLIFEDHLRAYDYWGHCDFDMLFGRITALTEKYHLERYDKFLNLGHLSLYRNTPECNARFTLTPKSGNSYRTSFAIEKTTQFDELGGINAIYEENRFPFFKERIFADISSQWKRMKLAEDYFDSQDKNYPKQVFYWENGKVLRTYERNGRFIDEEFLYIHIKKRRYAVPSEEVLRADSFYITPDSFAVKNGPVTGRDFRIYNPNHGAIYEVLEKHFIMKLRRRWHRRKSKR